VSRSWVEACVLAEAVGMTAAAGAARSATALTDHDIPRAALLGLLLIVLGGVVEGTALGWLQARALARLLGPTGRRRWLLATVLVAGIGWAAASAPAALAGDDGGGQPPLLLVLVGAAVLGTVMGAVLGSAQAWALRHQVRHPWRWVFGSAAGWTAAMPVIFVGATGVDAAWAWWLVLPAGAVTGAVAGALLGLVSGPFLDTLDRPPSRHRLALSR
jgi:hypothetical protein